MSTDKDLLPARDFVEASSGTCRLLKPRIGNCNLNLQLLTQKHLPAVLADILPAWWRCKSEVALVDGKILIDGQPQEDSQKIYTQMQTEQEAKQAKQGYSTARKKVTATTQTSKKKANASKIFGKGKSSIASALYDDSDSNYGGDQGSDSDWKDFEAQASKADTKIPSFATTRRAVAVSNATELDVAVRRCKLLWELVEGFPDKGNPLQQLQDMPCIPLALASNGVRLVSMQSGLRDRLLSIEDYTKEEVELLNSLGCFLARPGRKLRTALNLERASAVNALLRATERHRSSNSRPGIRTLVGIKDRILV